MLLAFEDLIYLFFSMLIILICNLRKNFKKLEYLGKNSVFKSIILFKFELSVQLNYLF